MTDLFSEPAAFFQDLVLKIPGLLLAVTVHELSHALVADRLGDPTGRLHGRITLNPFPHIDPLGAIAFIIAGFGWAKPVPVNARNLREPARDMALVAVAGPLSNFVVAFLGLVALVLFRRTFDLGGLMVPVSGILLWVFQLNLALAIFNLLPLPPLDGGHFLPYFLPRARSFVTTLEQFGPFILLALLLSGATRYVLGPVFNAVSDLYVAVIRVLL